MPACANTFEAAERSRKNLGDFGEDAACRYLTRKGFSILYRNWRCRLGEIDIIARDGRDLVFVEVKARRRSGSRDVLANITAAKRRRLKMLAAAFLAGLPGGVPPHRIDVLGILLNPKTGDVEEIEHIEAAV